MPPETLSVFMVSCHLLGTHLGWDPTALWQAAVEPGIVWPLCGSEECAMAIWSLPFCWELCDCSKPCVHIPSHAAAFQAVMKLVSMLDSCWPGQHLLALLCGRAEDGSHSPALPVPPPVCCQRWSSAPTHTRPLGTAGSRGPSGKEQLRLFLAFLEKLLEREQP